MTRPWRLLTDGLEVRVRATPRGGRDAVEGIETRADGLPVLKVRVRAAPEDGAANAAIRAVLAEALGCPARAVTLAAGATARVKLFRVAGDGQALAARIGALLGP
ncbi:protein of unknown function DUF167 [Methylobacterium sp. 4-46]|uniref:UPF0235 protein M446_3939 n=1 Tax=Methylobacterium sp. (strain 4-46) TaxID=426117 RepID=Y3939_METS4|nr:MULTISPECIES: DUF167 family protein [Methylobacterium]B0UH52.1 RecName: Full=UPF0235 protein M446_3939 [Methylobacterium sp. 4-46]ACA18305.1 protein of unknown function DUF167 [Methylobacterium sp. 4-46]WFT77604.1 DUF167 family protein [Methylobacterium nodulans]